MVNVQPISPIDRMTAENVGGLPHFQGGGLAQGVAQEVGGLSTELNEKIF
jgi:hypothetical protein